MGTSNGQGPTSLKEQRMRRVQAAFATLPKRYLGAEPGFDASFQIRLGDVGRTWNVRAREDECEVGPAVRREPDVVIGTDAPTWLALREGRVSGLDAFAQRRLYARGDLDLALGFEGLFELPGGRPPLLRVTDVKAGKARISSLISGHGEAQVICIHGLGSNKTSFFETVAALTPEHTVHAIDLPGFGGSSKPATAPYGAPYAAKAVIGTMDALGIERAHLVGNSLGGRVAIEVGLERPDRVGGIALLSPAVAFVRRDWHWLVRFARPELGMLPHSLGRHRIENTFWALFADRDLVDPSVADIVADEFERIYRSPGARLAFLSSARAIYLEAPFGRKGFYPRLSTLEPPALFVWSSHDRLIPEKFRHHVERWLPSAEQVVLEGCGHVPQVERPERTNGLLERFFARVDPLGGSRLQAA
jgi:pimeloyl-ACP methyl ester carboxylesterase